MAKLLMLEGLPASGKSFYAAELVAKGWKRVSKDDLRAMIDGGKWSESNEALIKAVESNLVFRFLHDGLNVVVDDTNFSYKKVWEGVAATCGAEFEVKFFDTPFLECIERDSKRGEKSVGAKVIQRMYDRYLKPPLKGQDSSLSDCFIVDIDGTIAKTNGRSNYDYTKVHTDIINRDVMNLIKILKSHNDEFGSGEIIIISGREESCRAETVAWLEDKGIHYSKLFMRQTEDNRKDSIVKREIYERCTKDGYNVLGVFDDRNQCVELWRELGLTCFQVAFGNF